MGRSRSTMVVVTEILEQQTTPITSSRLASLCDLTIQQTKDALKALSSKEEVRRLKDPSSSRGFLYLPLKPPAFKFVDPDHFTVEVSRCPVVWMRQQLTGGSSQNFSTLNTGRKNAAHVFNRSF